MDLQLYEVATIEPTTFDSIKNFIGAFLGQYSGRTREAYTQNLKDFGMVLGVAPELAIANLLKEESAGHRIALAYRAKLIESKKSPATINQRLACLRSLVVFAKKTGLVDWTLVIDGVKSRAYRDTKGPGRAGFKALLAVADPREKAIIWLMYGLALRRNEIRLLDLENVDRDRIWISGKGSGGELLPLTMPPQVRVALEEWIAVRGNEPGPLFFTLCKTRLWGPHFNRIIASLAKKAKVPHVRPHGLRHAAITEALELSRGDLRSVARFSRHRDVRVIGVYDDNRQDLGGAIAALVSAGAGI